MTKAKFTIYLLITIFLTFGLSLSLQNVLADWQAPVSSPPDGNAPKLIFASSTEIQRVTGVGTGNPVTDGLLINGPFTANSGTFLGVVDIPNNTALSFWNAAHTATLGMRADTSDRLSFATGGSWDRVVIDGSGNVGIGITNPGAHKLFVNGSLLVNTNTDTTPLYISRAGGTTEALGISVRDTITTFKYTNDEVSNRIDFVLENTDTESGGGANANTNTVLSITGDTSGGNTRISGNLNVNQICDANGSNCKTVANLPSCTTYTKQVSTGASDSQALDCTQSYPLGVKCRAIGSGVADINGYSISSLVNSGHDSNNAWTVSRCALNCGGDHCEAFTMEMVCCNF